jgi:hypothetical protein
VADQCVAEPATDDLAALVAKMTDGGVAFRKPISGGPGARYVMVEAPDGVLLELFEMSSPGLPPGARAWFSWDHFDTQQNVCII